MRNIFYTLLFMLFIGCANNEKKLIYENVKVIDYTEASHKLYFVTKDGQEKRVYAFYYGDKFIKPGYIVNVYSGKDVGNGFDEIRFVSEKEQ